MQLHKPRWPPLMMVAMAGMTIIGILVALALWQDIQSLRQQTQRLQQDGSTLSKLQRSEQKVKRALQKNQDGHAPSAGSLSGTADNLLAHIETSWKSDVSLLRMDADMRNQRMKIELLAKSDDALFEFIARLKQQFGESVFLERQAVAKEALWPLQANLVFEW